MNFNYKTSKKFIKIRSLLLRIKLAANRTARSSAAIGGVCPRKLKEMVFIFTATRALINAHILVVLNRAAAFTVRYIGSISFCTTANMKILRRKKLL